MTDASAQPGEGSPVDQSTGVPSAPLQMVVHPRGLERIVLSILNMVAGTITCLVQMTPGLACVGAFMALIIMGHECWAAAPFLLLVLTMTVSRWAWGR